MELCCLTQSRLDVSFKKGCKSQWNARIRENRFLFQKTWRPNKQLQHLLNLIRVFISQQLCICEYITEILAKREWLQWKWRRRVQSQSWLCFVGMTVRSSLCPRLASSQRSPTRCHSTNSSLMPVWCVLNCVCVCECVCTPVQSWDTEEPVGFPGDTVSVMKKCGRKKEDDNKWVYAPETAIHLIAQEPAYEERLGKDDGGVCVCVCC